MVPVLDRNLNPLMPCKERRARTMMEKGRAKPYWKDGIFCIILQEEPSARNYQDIVIGVDPGTKREGFTVMTEHRVVMNITSNAITHVKDKMESRKNLRGNRRKRKTPYRECRNNRHSRKLLGRLPPSIKSRWDAKLRIIGRLKNMIPITDVSVEDVSAKTIKNAKKWNTMFSPVESGKHYFYKEILKLGMSLFKWDGYDTYVWRTTNTEYKKTCNKLSESWTAHNVDSHCLCEMMFGFSIRPIKLIKRLIFFCPMRRNLFKQNIIKGGILRRDGGSIAVGIKKYTLVRHPKYGLVYTGGTTKNRISLYDIHTNLRLCQNAKKCDLKVHSYNLKWYIKHIRGDD